MFSLIKIVNFILIVILAILLIKNRHMKHQQVYRALFVVILCFFIYSVLVG